MATSLILSGKVVNQNGRPVSNVRVEAWDKDLIGRDDFLGSYVTDDNGRFTIDPSDHKELIFDKNPDIYFKVIAGNNELIATRNKVMKNLKSNPAPVTLTVDYAGKMIADEEISPESNGSFLSSPKYGYDFVVATTQASINAGLKEYLGTNNQPETVLCFLADSMGNPTIEISLDDLKAKTGGIDPFDIPNGTAYSDPRINTLTKNMFVVGIKLKLGLPPGVMPKDMPPIVVLGSSANSVQLNLFCSELQIIQNSPPSGFGAQGAWDVWSQPSGTPWFFTTTVNLVYADLDNELNTPYFNNHPDQKQALLNQLKNLGSGAFSLQQLLFDLDNAAIQSIPKIEGLDPRSDAGIILSKSFLGLYCASAKEYGDPLLAVHAVADAPDGSSLRLTGIEREVSQLVDGNGVVISNPTQQQKEVATLDYLCAVNNNPLPGAATFNWNWVEPADIGNESGVIAINRNTLANYYKNLLLPVVSRSCLKPWTSIIAYATLAKTNLSLTPGQTPQSAIISKQGPEVLTISYTDAADSNDKWGLTYGELDLHTSYTCKVSFSGNTITIIQNLTIYVKVQFDDTSTDGNVVNKTITDTYTLSVGQDGTLQVTAGKPVIEDDSQKIDLSGIITLLVEMNDAIDQITEYAQNISSITLHDIPANDFQNFIFPGAKVFTYKDVQFSENQDLLMPITYVAPDVTPDVIPDVTPDVIANREINATYSAEMMRNYLLAEIISAQKKFEALQTGDGHSLLFSIATDGIFYLIREENGTSATGWSKTDLSSAQIKRDFSGQAGVTCRTFDAGQSVQDGSLGLAMILSTSAGDHLYLCLGNSNKNNFWADSPNWVSYEYDNPNTKLSNLEIVNVFFCEATGGTQYIMVDVLRDPDSAVKDIRRFYIDPGKKNGYYWNTHDLPVDIEADKYDSCLGRASNGYVDGLYTAGHAGSGGQLEFSPVINVYGDAPPTAVRLNLPGGAIPSAIAATRNSDLSTDLFAVSGNALYYFSNNNQADGATGVPLITNDVIFETSKLSAMNYDGVITIWGRNVSNEIYYTSCPQSQVSDPSAWSIPVPILSGIEEISPYVNRVDGGNTIFASGGGKLWRITQASNSTSKLWQTNQITLPVPPTSKSISFNSYTTTILVTDEQNQPLSNASLSLSANNRCTVYINGLYYIVDSSPIHIKTNLTGSITIIEATGTLNGTTFTLSTASGFAVTINPMDKPFKKLAALNTADNLKMATINDSNGKPRPLVASSTSDEDLQTVAAAMGNLGKSYGRFSAPQAGAAREMSVFAAAPAPALAMDMGDAILIAAGDLFKWLESGIEAVIDVVEDAATGVWHFIATIAGKVYRAVLDTVEAVVGAVVTIFNVIKTTIEDLIKFVEFLFDWDDIKRVKNVLHNLVKLFLNHQIDGIEEIKHDFDNVIASAIKAINGWAGIGDLPGLGADGTATVNSKSTPLVGQSSPGSLLSYHFQNNAQNASLINPIVSPEPPSNLISGLITELMKVLEKEKGTLDDALESLLALAKKATSMSVVDLIKALIGILADTLLESAQNVIDALFDILYDVAKAALQQFDAPIHIPVISDILNDIGIPEFSFLDIACWVAAVPVTIGYKIAHDAAPFPDNAETSFLINATDFQSVVNSFSGPPHLAMATSVADSTTLASAAGPNSMSSDVASAVFITGHAVAGVCGLLSAVLDSMEAAEEVEGNGFAIPAAVSAIVGGASNFVANVLVPYDPIKDPGVSEFNTLVGTLFVVNKVYFYFAGQPKFGNFGAEFSRKSGAIVDAFLAIPALFCTCWHFYELSQDPAGGTRSIAIVNETSNLMSYLARISYTVAVNSEAEVKGVAIGFMAGSEVVYGGLQFALTMIKPSENE